MRRSPLEVLEPEVRPAAGLFRCLQGNFGVYEQLIGGVPVPLETAVPMLAEASVTVRARAGTSNLLLRDRDSNPNFLDQNQACCHYTIPQ